MADAAIKIKIMPDSPEANLSEITKKAKSAIKAEQGTVVSVEEEPVAFGLKAIIITLTRDESLDQDPLTEPLQKIEHVSSVQIIDFRRIGF